MKYICWAMMGEMIKKYCALTAPYIFCTKKLLEWKRSVFLANSMTEYTN